MADAKEKANAGNEEQSMEEILQSIRKIIAEENDDPSPKSEESPATATEDVTDSEVLELTDAIQPDGSVININNLFPDESDVLSEIDEALSEDDENPEPAKDIMESSAEVELSTAKPEQEMDIDALMAEFDAPKQEEPVFEAEPELAEPPVELAPVPSFDSAPILQESTVEKEDDGLVSAASIAASAEAMRLLTKPPALGNLPFASGETVEGLVAQLLRPMLKEWLDTHLPIIVQQQVEKEVRRITKSLNQ